MQFNDRRGAGLIDPSATTAEGYRNGMKNPNKLGQSSRAKYARLANVDRAVTAGSATMMAPSIQHAPVPAVVQQHVDWSKQSGNVLPTSRPGRGGRILGALRSLDRKAGF